MLLEAGLLVPNIFVFILNLKCNQIKLGIWKKYMSNFLVLFLLSVVRYVKQV